MKRFFIISGVVVAIAALIAFNRLTSRRGTVNYFAEVKSGLFEISVTNSGELLAEKSVDIYGPQIGMADNQQQQNMQGGNRMAGSTGGSRQGGSMGGGGGMGGGQRSGGDMRVAELKILDIVPEGTIVKEGDYIAQLDRSSYSNTLQDELTKLTTYRDNVEMKTLDTAVVLTNLRDDIKNQRFIVEEAVITLEQSKFEPPATIRQAEISLDKAQRTLTQKIKSYDLQIARNLSEIKQQQIRLSRQERLVNDLQDYLSKFTIKAPSPGMVIYKKERNGSKRKTGSQLNAFDLVVATLPDLTTMMSKVYVNEIEVSKIKAGQKVIISVDAFPKKSYSGSVQSIANIGEVLPNSDAKMFEVQITVDGTDPNLRPSMTTGNKIIIKTYEDATFIPTECVLAGSDSIPFVYAKNKTKRVVVLGESNEKNVIIEQGLEAGSSIYVIAPADAESFKLVGENLIPVIRERNKARKLENEKFRKVLSAN